MNFDERKRRWKSIIEWDLEEDTYALIYHIVHILKFLYHYSMLYLTYIQMRIYIYIYIFVNIEGLLGPMCVHCTCAKMLRRLLIPFYMHVFIRTVASKINRTKS